MAVFGAAAVLLVCLWSLWIWHKDIEVLLAEMSVYFRDSVHFLDGVPLICYSLVIFVLPIFFLPITPVFILASARPEPYAAILAYCWLGVTLNIVASYFISRKFGIFLRRKLSERGINIEDISQTILQEYFAMIMLVDISGADKDVAALAAECEELGKSIGMSIRLQHEAIFNAMHNI